MVNVMINKKINRIIIGLLATLTSILILNTYSFLLRYYSVLRWIVVIIIVLCCVFGPKSWGFRFSKQLIKNNLLWIVFSIYLWLGCIFSYDKDSSVNYCIVFTSYMLLLFVGKMKKYYEKLFDILEMFLLFGAFSIYVNLLIPNIMIGPLRFFISPAAISNVEVFVSKHVFTGIFGDNANAAFAMNIGFAISLIKYISKRVNKYLIQSIFFFGTLLFIGKRMLIIIPIIMICISALLLVKSKSLKRNIVGVLILLILIFAIATTIPSVEKLFFRNSDDLLTGRSTILWPIAFMMFNSRKMFGTGINTFNYMINTSNTNNTTLANWGYHAHNIYIQLLGETGLIGIVFLGSLLLVNITRTVRLIKSNSADRRILSISMLLQVLWIIYGMTGNTFYYTAQLLVYIVAVGCMEAVRNEKK